jgi:hypothetical protein
MSGTFVVDKKNADSRFSLLETANSVIPPKRPGGTKSGKGDVCSPSTRQEVSEIGTENGRRRAPSAWTRAACYSRAFGALLDGAARTVYGAAGDRIRPAFLGIRAHRPATLVQFALRMGNNRTCHSYPAGCDNFRLRTLGRPPTWSSWLSSRGVTRKWCPSPSSFAIPVRLSE